MPKVYAVSTITLTCQDIISAFNSASPSEVTIYDGLNSVYATATSSIPSGANIEIITFDYNSGVVSNCNPSSLTVDTSGVFSFILEPNGSNTGSLYYTPPTVSPGASGSYSPPTIKNLENPVSAYNNNFVGYTLSKVILPVLYGVLGLIVFVLVSYAGFLWMTSNGDPKNLDKAKSVLTGAIIGAIIIIMAYALSLLLLHSI